MKICCVNPPIEDFYSTAVRRQPLGLLYVMAALKNAGHDISFINCHSPKSQRMEIPEEFSYLKPWISSGKKDTVFPFRGYYHFGMSWQEIEKRIRLTEADLFMISSLFTTYHEETARVIEIIRKHKREAIIAAGGYHAALYPEYFTGELGIEYVITGEGETASVLLMEHLEGKRGYNIPGLMVRGESNIDPKIPEDIDALPLPAREFLRERDFMMYRKKAVSMIGSRGCPHRCSFCTGKSLWGYSYRPRKIDSVIQEIKECVNRFKTEIFNFEDDNLFPSEERALEILEALAGQNRGGLEFTAMNGISIENLSPEIMPLMKRAGFNEINISLVTRSEALQRDNRRPFDSNTFEAIAKAGLRAGMKVRAYYILGLPGQTREEVEDTLNFLKSTEVISFPSVYYNVNSPRAEWKAQRSSAFFNETEYLSRDDLLKYFNFRGVYPAVPQLKYPARK